MKYRKLRIAWTVAWGLAAVLLIVLWVRSYRHGHLEGYFRALPGMCCRSINGFVVAMRLPAQTETETETPRKNIVLTFSSPEPVDIGTTNTWSGFIFDWHTTGFWWVQMPYWFLVITPALFAALPWARQLRWRFSLRTLLIATTLVAVVLGLIVWAVK
jgi:hypothetical protein